MNVPTVSHRSHWFRVLAAAALALALLVSLRPAVGATPGADLTIAKETDPAGGADYSFTLDPGAVTFAGKWGTLGVGQGQFNGPFGIAVDGAGNVYVADTFDYRVQKFDADGDFILMWGRDVQVGGVTGSEICLAAESCKAGTSGTGNGEFNLPHGIAVDAAGNVYVGDSFNHRIQKFDADGNYLGQWGGTGADKGQFNRPNGVAVDGAGNVYVADTVNGRIQKFNTAGTFLAAWGYNVIVGGDTNFEICTPTDTCKAGDSGTANGQFDDPFGVAVYGGSVYVADTFNHRIQAFDSDGNYQNKWGSEGPGSSNFNRPYGIAADAAGNLYVADALNSRIKKFNGGGDFLGEWGTQGSDDGQFDFPTGVAVSAVGDAYAIDYELHRVQRFSQTGVVLDDGQSYTFEDLAVGTYLVSELVPDGSTLDDIDCGAAIVTESGHTVSVTLAEGDAVTCTFSNSYTPLDTTPPDTTIATGPTGTVSSNDATFTFSSSEGGSTFQCQLDDGAYAACNGGSASYPDLTDGSHTFAVYACDAANNCDATPATRAWTIDTTPPNTTIATGPTGTVSSNDATFTFSSSEGGSTFQCQLDDGAYAACNGGSASYPDLSDGPHTFAVYACDAAGNCDPTPATRTWTIDTPDDTTPPNTTIATGPSGTVSSDDATFTFSSSEGGSTFQCKLDDGAYAACNGGSASYPDLSDGPHTFAVYACDAAGNCDATPATRTWTIDTTPPADGVVFVTASGGAIPGFGSYQKNDILKWDGAAWSVWFDGAGKTAAAADIIAFDVANEAAATAYLSFRQAQRGLNGLAVRLEPQDIAYWNGTSYSFFLDGSDVGLSTTGERINGIEVLDGSVSPIGTGCLYYVLISTNAAGAVRNGTEPAIRFTGEDVLGLCLTQSGPHSAGLWHVAFEGQSEGLQRNNGLGLSASDDATTLYFTLRQNFTGDGGPVGPSQLVSFSGGVFSGPLWQAADHGLTQQVDGIDVVGTLP